MYGQVDGFSGSEINSLFKTVIENKYINSIDDKDENEAFTKEELTITVSDVLSVIAGMKDHIMRKSHGKLVEKLNDIKKTLQSASKEDKK